MAEPTPEEKRRQEEERAKAQAAAAKPQPLAAPTPEQVQANLPGLSVGQQTRGAGGVRLDQQQAPAGKELIGMRSGVPIYADATDVYSNEASKLEKTLQGPTQSGPAVGASVEQMRAAYQTGPTATAVRAQQAPEKKPGEPANAGGFFSKEYADQFTAAQEAANQRAKERIAYGGQPVRDTSNSMAIANNAASALRNIAAGPKTVGMEELRSSGLPKTTQDRLAFQEGVTSGTLEEERKRQGINIRRAPTFGGIFRNPFSRGPY